MCVAAQTYSDRKHIRTEKARIRRQFLDAKKQAELITELYKKMVPSLREKFEIRNSKSLSDRQAGETSPKPEIKKTETKVAKVKKAKVAAKK